MAVQAGDWKADWTVIRIEEGYALSVVAARQAKLSWLLEKSNPGSFVVTMSHYGSLSHRVTYYISDPNVAFAFKMRFG